MQSDLADGFRTPLFLAAVACCADLAMAQNASSVDFGRDVYGILQTACFECHGPEKQEGELRLDTRDALLESGSVVAKNPDDSELLRRITLPAGHDEIMPAIGDPLSAKQVDVIRRWIQQGAVWPNDFQAAQHWSYVAPVRPQPSELTADKTVRPKWLRSPIDYFVAQKLQQEGLSPSPDATPEELIRRVYFSLIGLPPTPAEVQAFAKSPTDDAYRAVVDSLLQRPQFGERWARPWLDLASYADSHGFQRDNLREVWAYRDWVIQALNDDMPFDQFTLEQIAGDLLPNATESQKIATGFHRCTPTNVEAGSIPEETRIEQVIDRVNTTAAVWLGSTFECCQCHDHKYDPFTAKDYYQLLAFFNNTEAEADRTDPKKASSIQFKGPKMPLSNPQKDAQRQALRQQQQTIQKQLASRKTILAKDLPAWTSSFLKTDGGPPQTHVLEVIEFHSTGKNDSHRVLDDGSVLLAGKSPPATDEYTVTAKLNRQNVTAIQLEAFTHDQLPGRGPGRGDAKRTNFVLNRFSAERRVAGTEATDAVPLTFASAIADFSQKNWDVGGALNEAPGTGWAISPQTGKSHWAKFLLAEPLNCGEPQLVTFRLMQDFGSARSIGCFRLSAITGNVAATAVPGDITTLLKQPAAKWTKADREKLVTFRSTEDPEFAKLKKKRDALKAQEAKLVDDTTLVMIELPKPRMSYVFDRGDYKNHGDPVQAGTPGVLHPMAQPRQDRIGLAQWLTDPANPLVGRVTVNRLWGELFGRGIVATPEDFGIKGERPSHPKLLDWLAVEFVENGWSTKQLLRTIVLSSTYRQSSRITPELAQRDDQNRLLARGPRYRMDAEMIRDNLLAASGLLSLKQFGPPIRPYQPNGIWAKVGGESYKYEVSAGAEQHRRGIYVVLKRGAPYPSFVNFDASARLSCTVQRSRTNTPLQALTLLNDPVYVQAAEALATRVVKDEDNRSAADKVSLAFQLCTARPPSEHERNVLLDLFETQLSINRAREHSPESVKPAILSAKIDSAEFAAWCSVASSVINLHETLTQH